MKREVSNLVSEEVLKAAEAHASSKFKRGAEFHEWSIARDSFIEGHNHLIKNKSELKLQNHVQEIGK
jgi:hypothetical protein